MFLKYYGLIEQPFGVTPDSRFLHLGSKHREALASLVYGTEANRGFVALIARPGMGKTSLLVHYLDRLRNRAQTAYLFQTGSDARELLRQILGDLGIDAGGKDLPAMHDALNRVLLEEQRLGRRFVLVIDEAQNLDEKVLESVRLLSNFETPTRKLMHIVLAGQPQLAERLASPSMTQFRQRISILIRLDPFTLEETNAYIDHRLRVAGYAGPPLFTDSALHLIAEHSEGIPRNINNLCFGAMSLAYATDSKRIDVETVREAISDLDMESLVREPKGTRSSSPSEVLIFKLESASQNGRAPFNPVLSSTERRRSRKVPGITSVAALSLLGILAGGLWIGGVRTPQLSVASASETPVLSEAPVPEAITAPVRMVVMDSAAQGAAVSSATGFTSTQESTQLNFSTNLRTRKPILTATVAEGATLRQTSLKYLGRFDSTIVAEICKLNPLVTNPDQIKAGQRVRLPLYLQRIRARGKESGLGTPRASETP